MQVFSSNLFNVNFSSVPEIYPVTGRACSSVHVDTPLRPLALKHTAIPPRITTVRQAILNTRKQDVKNQGKLVARNIILHYRPGPRIRKSKLRECMKEMIFQKDFWLWINNDKIDGYYTPIKIPKGELPTAPTYPNFGRRFPPTDYPASFWALAEELRILEKALTDIIRYLEACREQFTYLFVRHSLVDDLRDGHQEMLNLIDSYLSGEKDGLLAYPDIQVPSFALWSLLEVIVTDHRSMLNSIEKVQELCCVRDHTLRLLLRQFPFPGNAPLRQHLEAKANEQQNHASERAQNLLKTHVAYKQQFMKLHGYFMKNMSYVPVGGVLFEEERKPIVLDPIFDGFAMNPAVEVRAFVRKEEFSDTE